jgi:hypothetical protein
MADPKKTPDPDERRVQFTSDGDILEITEDNTKPGKVSERYRRMLEQKYGRKTPPPNGPAEGRRGS